MHKCLLEYLNLMTLVQPKPMPPLMNLIQSKPMSTYMTPVDQTYVPFYEPRSKQTDVFL